MNLGQQCHHQVMRELYVRSICVMKYRWYVVTYDERRQRRRNKDARYEDTRREEYYSGTSVQSGHQEGSIHMFHGITFPHQVVSTPRN